MTTAIILAGGLGTRLRSLVPDLPKPMAPIGGRPFLEYQLDYWIKQGIEKFILSVGYRYEVIVEHFGSRYKDAELDYVIEKTPLGTGGGVLLAIEKVSQCASFLLLNGDTYFAVDLPTLMAFALKNDADWCFSLFYTREEGRYMGMSVSAQGQITALRARESHLANGGVYWVHPRALRINGFASGDKVSLEDAVLPAALARGQRLFGVEFSGGFIDIGVPSDYCRAPAFLTG